MATQLAMTKSFEKFRTELSIKFPAKKVDEILQYYEALRRDAWLDRYDSCLVNGGKFVEAVLKCFHFLRTGIEVDSITKAIDEIQQLESDTKLNIFERMTMPRIIRAIYEFRNKRGGAHNSSFDPIKMDCAVIVAMANWIMEELTRLYLVNDPIAAQRLVENLLVKDIPLVEEIEGDRLVLIPGLSARIQLEIILYTTHPERCQIKDLIRWVHDQSSENIRVTLRTMKQKKLVHETDSGWILTALGVHEAEVEIAKLKSGISGANKTKEKGVKHGKR